ncbi:hypothetical protein ACFE04_023611 [Oxalis oulophora]
MANFNFYPRVFLMVRIEIAEAIAFRELVIVIKEAVMVNNFLHVHSNGESMKQYTSHEYTSYVENLSNHTMWQPRQSKSPDFLPRPKYPSARHRAANTEHISKREKAVNTDRLRRERIAERIKALEGLLPHPMEISDS